MNLSMDDSLVLMRPHLSPEIISAQTYGRLRRLASSLPPAYWGGFECHLGDGPDAVDFHQGHLHVDSLKKCFSLPGPRPDTNRNDIEKRLECFSALWAHTGSRTNRHVARVSLEFDPTRHDVPQWFPSVFLFLEPFLFLEKERVLKPLIDEFLSALTSSPVPPGIYKTIQKLNHAAGHFAIAHLGAMVFRPTPALRLVIAKLSAAAVLEVTACLTRPKEAARIESILSNLDDCTSSFAMSLDILPESISSVFGIESYPRPDATQPDSCNWIERFSEMGFCSDDQAKALARWPGLTTPANADAPWPADLLKASLLRAAHQFSCFSRYVNHIKISFSPDRPPLAKAYLGFIHDWIDLKSGPGAQQETKGKFTG